MTGKEGASPEAIVRDIKRKTRLKFTAEEKIRIALEGLRGEVAQGLQRLSASQLAWRLDASAVRR